MKRLRRTKIAWINIQLGAHRWKTESVWNDSDWLQNGPDIFAELRFCRDCCNQSWSLHHPAVNTLPPSTPLPLPPLCPVEIDVCQSFVSVKSFSTMLHQLCSLSAILTRYKLCIFAIVIFRDTNPYKRQRVRRVPALLSLGPISTDGLTLSIDAGAR